MLLLSWAEWLAFLYVKPELNVSVVWEAGAEVADGLATGPENNNKAKERVKKANWEWNSLQRKTNDTSGGKKRPVENKGYLKQDENGYQKRATKLKALKSISSNAQVRETTGSAYQLNPSKNVSISQAKTPEEEFLSSLENPNVFDHKPNGRKNGKHCLHCVFLNDFFFNSSFFF